MGGPGWARGARRFRPGCGRRRRTGRARSRTRGRALRRLARDADASADTATDAAHLATDAADTATEAADTAASEADRTADSAETSVDEIADQAAAAARETDQLVEQGVDASERDPAASRPGPPINRRSPFYIGFVAAIGVLAAYGLVHLVLQLKSVFTYIVLALFLSLGLDPVVSAMNRRRGIGRGWAVLMVVGGVACIFALIGWVIVPPVVTQATQLVKNAPDYVKQIEHNHLVEQIDHRWHVTTRAQEALQKRSGAVFGGLLGAGKVLFDGIVGAFTVLVLTLYFLAAMPRVKSAAYQLIPRPRRARVVYLSEEITRRVGGYVLGQLCVATINCSLSYVMIVPPPGDGSQTRPSPDWPKLTIVPQADLPATLPLGGQLSRSWAGSAGEIRNGQGATDPGRGGVPGPDPAGERGGVAAPARVSASHLADLLGRSRAMPYEARKRARRGDAGYSTRPSPRTRRPPARPAAPSGVDAQLLRAAWETLHNPRHPRVPSVLGFLRVVEATGCRGADLARLVGASPSAAQAATPERSGTATGNQLTAWVLSRPASLAT